MQVNKGDAWYVKREAMTKPHYIVKKVTHLRTNRSYNMT